MEQTQYPAVQAMIDLLEEQKALHQELLELSYEKRQVIIKGNTERLSVIMQREIQGLARMNEQERKRLAQLDRLAGELGVSPDEVTVSTLIEKTEGSLRTRLQLLQKELGAILLEQSELNKINQRLLQAQLDYGEAMLNVMVEPEDPLNNFYGGDGAAEPEKREGAGFFDAQI